MGFIYRPPVVAPENLRGNSNPKSSLIYCKRTIEAGIRKVIYSVGPIRLIFG